MAEPISSPGGKKDNTNLILALGVGTLAFYLWQKQKAAEAVLAVPVGPGGAGLPGAVPRQIDPLTGIVATGLNAIVPGAGGLAPIVVAEINEARAMAEGIIHGGFDIETAGRVAELVTAPISVPLVAAVNFVSDLFGWSGHPLDTVNDVLLAAITDPNWQAHDNVPPAASVYAMDSSGVLHAIQYRPGCSSPDTLWCADFSWREIIAVPPNVFNSFPIGADITSRAQIETMARPQDPAEIRRVFGPYARFKVGTTTLHGPWELGL